MATFRQVHVRMWDNDGKFEELSPSAKLLFIYSWSNGHRNEACLYEITKRKISSETGLDLITLDRALDELSAAGMVFYDNEKYYLWAVNALKYQSINANNVTAVLRDILACPSVLAKKYAEYWRPALEGYINRWGMAWAWDDNGMPMELDTHTDKGKGNNKGKGNGKDKEKDNHNPPNPPNAPVDPEDELGSPPPGDEKDKHSGGGNGNNLVKDLEKVGILMPSPFQLEKICYWEKQGMEYGCISLACEIAARANKRRIDYIEAILKRWYDDGIRTKLQAEAQVKARLPSRQASSPPREPPKKVYE